MLLRSVSKHVTDQNWFAVFIDFLIVVVGVFIGIQVANWNEVLKAKQTERIYIERMHDDTIFAQEFADKIITRRIQGFKSGLGMIKLMESDGSELSNDYVDCYFPSIVSTQIDLPFLNSINELMATGNVNVLTDTAIRHALLELQNRSELLRRFQDQTTGSIVDIEDVFADAIRLRAQINPNEEIRLHRQCDLKTLHANNRYKNAINNNIDTTDAFINNRLIPWSEKVDQLHKLLDESLNISHQEN